MTKEEKQEEIISKYGLRYANADKNGVESIPIQALQEYGDFIRQQTLEEAIGILGRYYPDIKSIVDDVVIIKIYKDLQALKNKN